MTSDPIHECQRCRALTPQCELFRDPGMTILICGQCRDEWQHAHVELDREFFEADPAMIVNGRRDRWLKRPLKGGGE